MFSLTVSVWKWNLNQSFTQWKWTYTLDCGPWMWSALNIGFVDKLPSRLQGHWFSKSAWSSSFWSVGARKPGFSARTAAPARIYLPRTKRSGVFSVPVRDCLTTYGLFNLLSANPGCARTATGLRIHTSRSTSSSLRLWPWMCSSKGKD